MIARGAVCWGCNQLVEHRPEKLCRRRERCIIVCGHTDDGFHVLFCVATVKQAVHLFSCLLIALHIDTSKCLQQGHNAGAAFPPVFNRLFNSRFLGKIMLGVYFILSNIIFCAETRFLLFVIWVFVCGFSVFVYEKLNRRGV